MRWLNLFLSIAFAQAPTQTVPSINGIPIEGYFVDHNKAQATANPSQKVDSGKCTPDVCPKDPIDWSLAACVDRTDVADCLIDALGPRPSATAVSALLYALENGWIKRPWGLEVHQRLFPLLQAEDDGLRALNAKWYEIDLSEKGLSNKTNEVSLAYAAGRVVYTTPRPAVAPGSVEVYSSFGNVAEVGTGNLLSAPSISDKTSFVLTAAHLLGGKNAGVRLRHHEFKILGQIVDNELDIAAIEIPKVQFVAMDYQPDKQRLLLSENAERALYSKSAPFAWLGINTRNLWRGPSEAALAFFINPWADAGIETFVKALDTEDPLFEAIGLSYDRRHFIARARVTGGTSGSVVFRGYRVPVIEGFITQSNYYLSETRLTRATEMIALLEKYRQGQRGSVTGTAWKMRNGLTYRQFPGGWTEANFVDGRTGKGVFVDPGKGVFVDPGKGVFVDPAQKNWSSDRPSAVFRHYGIAPGMLYKGQPVVGIYARAKKSNQRSLLLYADQISLDFMNRNASSYDFSLISNDDGNLLRLSRERMGIMRQGSVALKCKSGAPDSLFEENYHPIAGKNFTASFHSVTFANDQIHVRLRTYAKNWLNPKESDPSEMLELTLDKNGALPGEKFLPIIEVRGRRTGEIYIVDVRKLLFDDLSQVIIPPKLNTARDVHKEISRQLNLVAIRVRNANSGLEFGYTFSR